MNVYTMIHVRRTPVRRTCTAYMYHSVNTLLVDFSIRRGIPLFVALRIISGPVPDMTYNVFDGTLNLTQLNIISGMEDGRYDTVALSRSVRKPHQQFFFLRNTVTVMSHVQYGSQCTHHYLKPYIIAPSWNVIFNSECIRDRMLAGLCRTRAHNATTDI